MDVTNNLQVVKQPKVIVQAFVVEGEKTLLTKRLKHPFKDKLGFMSGKVAWGMSAGDTLIKECVEEMGIVPVKYKLFAIRRCIDYDAITNELIFDAIYYNFIVTEYKGEEVDSEESECVWVKFAEIGSINLGSCKA